MKKLYVILFLLFAFNAWALPPFVFHSGSIATSEITHINTQTYSSTSTDAPTCDKPTGTAQNDLMTAVLVIEAGDDVTSAPSGWTQVYKRPYDFASGQLSEYFYYRVAGASEGASYAWGLSGAREAILIISAFRGTTSIGNHAVTTNTGSSASAVSPAITIQKARNWAIAVASNKYGTTWTPSADPEYTELADVMTEAVSTRISAIVSYREWPSTGSTGDITSTAANADYWNAGHVEIIRD